MANYTCLLRTLLNDSEYKQLIDEAMSTYPMYVPEHEQLYALIPSRSELNKKILNHYKYREIAFETPFRFVDELQIALEEIMPTYYSMYKSIDMMNNIDDIFGNVNMTETFEETRTGTASSTNTSMDESSGTTKNTGTNKTESSASSTSNSKNVSSDTPQSELTIGTTGIDSVDYASNVSWNKDLNESENTSTDTLNTTISNETSGTGTSTSDDEHSETVRNTHHREGNQGVNTYAHDMVEFRSLFMNIEQQIINDARIQELFMLIY